MTEEFGSDFGRSVLELNIRAARIGRLATDAVVW
jgi:hypothetical protein